MTAEQYPVQFKGHALARWVLRQAGWTVRFEGLPQRQGLIIGYPHTSNWDFMPVMLAKWAMGIEARFLAKRSLFRVPLFAHWLRWIGAEPVDRGSPSGVVAQLVSRIKAHQHNDGLFWLGISPEGTRSLTPGWKSGFYRVAIETGVPVGLMHIDWGQRQIVLCDFIALTGDLSHDYALLARAYHGVQGRRPALASPIRPLSTQTADLGQPSHHEP